MKALLNRIIIELSFLWAIHAIWVSTFMVKCVCDTGISCLHEISVLFPLSAYFPRAQIHALSGCPPWDPQQTIGEAISSSHYKRARSTGSQVCPLKMDHISKLTIFSQLGSSATKYRSTQPRQLSDQEVHPVKAHLRGLGCLGILGEVPKVFPDAADFGAAEVFLHLSPLCLFPWFLLAFDLLREKVLD